MEKASSAHSGPSALYPDLESIEYTWILNVGSAMTSELILTLR